MILGQISWLDCFVFLGFLAPQLILHVGFFPTLCCALRALPFLLIELPVKFVYERFLVKRNQQSPFVQQASSFEDVIIRCVRYAFAFIPASIGRVFFSKAVALPFLRFRMLRHGYFRWPIHWHEVKQASFQGLWITIDPTKEPDIIVYYAHGGGFSMGSSFFYLEFLIAFASLIKSTTRFENPAILALEYTLVPDSSYPVQLNQTLAGYKYAMSIIRDPSKIIVSGDSAGGTLILSLLLRLGNDSLLDTEIGNGISQEGTRPGMAVLISPWVTLISAKDENTTSDYLDANNLHRYARQYAGTRIFPDDPLISPGNCKDVGCWKAAAPINGFLIPFGKEEVFAPVIRDFITLLQAAGLAVATDEAKGGIHAWPVASLFLSSTRDQRLKGLKTIVKQIGERMR